MPWECKMIGSDTKISEMKPGDMFFNPRILEYKPLMDMLSPEYMRDWFGKRPPIQVMLPNNHLWCADYKFTGKEHGWVVTGEAPNITTMPSINSSAKPGYHGWLKNGILSDDVEGRKL